MNIGWWKYAEEPVFQIMGDSSATWMFEAIVDNIKNRYIAWRRDDL